MREASGEIVLFTDDDCEPFPNWLSEMLKPFDDPDVVGTKGVYRTRQPELLATVRRRLEEAGKRLIDTDWATLFEAPVNSMPMPMSVNTSKAM